MPQPKKQEQWGTRLGVILAVAGSAVGLGNFLRFPGQAAQNGGGAFMLPYFAALLILGIPLCWAEWTMGRYGGSQGFNSAPGIYSTIWRHPAAKYFGGLALLVPLVIYMYYVVIEAWCLGYAWDYLVGNLQLGSDQAAYAKHFEQFVGAHSDGFFYEGGNNTLAVIIILTFIVNFVLIYRGLSKGIEKFCTVAMPLMACCAIVVLVRVLTLGTPDASKPELNVMNSLGSMWNPNSEYLLKGQTWLAAAGQIFFSISAGFGIIINYASYLRKKDDVALSSLTSASINEFFEVCLGGLITLPAAFIFLGASALTMGTFGLGFNALPNVFAVMPAGRFFGFVWFFMLFLAAITSSISMLQPVLAFLEEGLGLRRRGAVGLLFVVTAIGSGFTVYFSKGLTALDTFDFWVGTFLIYTLAMFQTILYGWVFGIERGEKELRHGAHLHVPRLVQYVLKYVAPTYLLVIFGTFCWQSLLSHEDSPTLLSAAVGESLRRAPPGDSPLRSEMANLMKAAGLGLPDDARLHKVESAEGTRVREPSGKTLYILRSNNNADLNAYAYKTGTLEGLLYNPVALWSVLFILTVAALIMAAIFVAGRRWEREGRWSINASSHEEPRP